MRKLRTLLVSAFVLAAALAGTAVLARASVHVPFTVTVNGSTDVTYQHLTAGQVVYRGGAAERVVNVAGHAVRFSPALTGPSGTVYQFST